MVSYQNGTVAKPTTLHTHKIYSTPYFGGALCAKTDSDGNMIIEV